MTGWVRQADFIAADGAFGVHPPMGPAPDVLFHSSRPLTSPGFIMVQRASSETSVLTAELLEAADAFDAAQFRKDADALDQWLAPDLVYIRGTGEISDRAAFIEAFSDPDLLFEPFVIRERSVHLLSSDVAVVSAEAEIVGLLRGSPFHDRFRYSDTFLKTPQGWRVRFVQVTRLVEP